jgi:hypothetical protein
MHVTSGCRIIEFPCSYNVAGTFKTPGCASRVGCEKMYYSFTVPHVSEMLLLEEYATALVAVGGK